MQRRKYDFAGSTFSPKDLSRSRFLGSVTILVTYTFVFKTKHMFSTKHMATDKDMKVWERVYMTTPLDLHAMDSEITTDTWKQYHDTTLG